MHSHFTTLLQALFIITCLTASAATPNHKKHRTSLTEPQLEQTAPAAGTTRDISITNPAQQLSGEWEIQEVRRKRVMTADRAYLQFDFNNARVYGSSGCNFINGSIINNNSIAISFKNLTTTHHSCVTASAEQAILKALHDTHSMRADTDGHITNLYFVSSHGSTILSMRRTDLAALDGAWQVHMIDSLRVTDDNIRVVIDATQGEFHADATNVINGNTRIDYNVPASIQFENLHPTDDNVVLTATESQLMLALEETAVYNLGAGGELQLIDINGVSRVTLQRINLR